MLTIVHDKRPHFTARVWLNDLPDWPTLDPQFIELRLSAPPQADAACRRAAIEYNIPSCKGRNGAIGAQFTPDLAGMLEARIAHSPALGPHMDRAHVLSSWDTVHQGLASEYTDGVVEGVKTSDAASALGSGTLYIGWAAHGLVGSSHYEFAILTCALIQILAQTPASEEAIAALIATAITQFR